MFKDSDSPQNDYNSLLSWLEDSRTQEVLELLKLESDSLRAVLVQHVPQRDLGKFIGDFFHREQSFGEIRGLERIQQLLDQRKNELQLKLGLIKPTTLGTFDED